MTDIVERLRWSISADTPARYPDIVTEAIIEIERLRAALQRIDGINDNPAVYNPGIDLVIRAVLSD